MTTTDKGQMKDVHICTSSTAYDQLTKHDDELYFVPDDSVTQAELTAGLATKQDAGNYATQTDLQQGLATRQPLGEYATTAQLAQKSKVEMSSSGSATTTANYITVDNIQWKIGGSGGGPTITNLSSDSLTLDEVYSFLNYSTYANCQITGRLALLGTNQGSLAGFEISGTFAYINGYFRGSGHIREYTGGNWSSALPLKQFSVNSYGTPPEYNVQIEYLLTNGSASTTRTATSSDYMSDRQSNCYAVRYRY